MAKAPKIDQHKRLGEIIEVLRRNEITREMTPEKLCAVMEELGPTFIKLGQILSMRSDFLPASYCEALTRLRTQVEPMPYTQVEAILEEAYGRPLQEIFVSFDQKALGSASIAQVHAAELISGEKVVVKVQRKGIHETMNRDIILLKRAAEVLKYTPHKSIVDFNRVLDEMWVVAQQEMNFLTEAQNLEKFAQMNADVIYLKVPRLFPNYCTSTTLVMERIFGISIDDHDALVDAGYDLNEIGSKLADNYVKQITEDGFFHADPHPGNIRIQDGKIVYLDMGMMGVLSEKDRKTISHAVEGVARNNAEACMDAVLQLGVVHGDVDRKKLYKDCESMLERYGSMDLGSMDLSVVMKDIMEIMKTHQIGMPGGLSMLVRGLATMEGVVVDIAPSINVTQVATARISRTFLRDFNWKNALSRDAHAVYESAYKALDIPALISDALKTALRGEGTLGIEHQFGDSAMDLLRDSTKKVCAAIISAALILSAYLGSDAAFITVFPAIWSRLILILCALLLTVWILRPSKRK